MNLTMECFGVAFTVTFAPTFCSGPHLCISRSLTLFKKIFFNKIKMKQQQRTKHYCCVTGVVALCLWDRTQPTVPLGYVIYHEKRWGVEGVGGEEK